MFADEQNIHETLNIHSITANILQCYTLRLTFTSDDKCKLHQQRRHARKAHPRTLQVTEEIFWNFSQIRLCVALQGYLQ